MKILTLSSFLLVLPLTPFAFCQESAAPAVPAAPTKTPIERLEENYAADRAASLRRVLARYVDELEALQASLIASGDTSGAARVRLEQDRVLPALGLPAVAAEDAPEFAAFEEAVDLPPPPAPVILPGDLDAILKSLQPGEEKKASTETAPSTSRTPGVTPAGGKETRRALRMTNAQLSGSYDPLYPWQYWTTGRTASWTLDNLPAGSYQLVLRYTSDATTGGGKLQVKVDNTTLEADLAPTGSWKRRRELVIGPFPLTGPRADLVLTAKTMLPNASYLMDLNVLIVQPVPGAAKP